VDLAVETTRSVTIGVGSGFALSLPIYADSEASWVAVFDDTILEQLPEDASAGTSTRTVLRFEGLAAGRTELVLRFCEPTRCAETLEELRTLDITVEAAVPGEDEEDESGDETDPSGDLTDPCDPTEEESECGGEAPSSCPSARRSADYGSAVVIYEGNAFTLEVEAGCVGDCWYLEYDHAVLSLERTPSTCNGAGCTERLVFRAKAIGSTFLTMRLCNATCCTVERKYFVYVYERRIVEPDPCAPRCCQVRCCAQSCEPAPAPQPPKAEPPKNTPEPPKVEPPKATPTPEPPKVEPAPVPPVQTQEQTQDTGRPVKGSTQTQEQTQEAPASDPSSDRSAGQEDSDRDGLRTTPTPDQLVGEQEEDDGGLCGTMTGKNDSLSGLALFALLGLLLGLRRRHG